MSTYRIRAATLDDVNALVRHRLGMFADMGTAIDAAAIEMAFRGWLAEMMPAGVYRGWVVTNERDEIVGGGGMTVLPWPPGPWYAGGRIAFVYNVYVAPSHRRRGIARQLMQTIHDWCRQNGIGVIGLNASPEGRPLYEAMGYQPAANPLLFAGVDVDNASG